MADLVISNDLFLFFSENTIFFLFTGKYHFDRFKEIFLAHYISSVFDRHNGRLIYHIGKVGTYGTGCC